MKAKTPIFSGANLAPHSEEAEQSVLGSMMVQRQAALRGIELLQPSDFYRPADAAIFRAIKSLCEKNEPADPITLTDELRGQNELTDAGGTEYLMACINRVPTAANVEHYARIVKDYSTRRRVITASMEQVALAQDVENEVEEVVAALTRNALEISGTTVAELVPASEIMPQVWTQLEQYHGGKPLRGLSWGLSHLNALTYGVCPGDFVIVGGRPSQGKSALLTQLMVNAVSAEVGVLFYSQEMSGQSLLERAVFSMARMDGTLARAGQIEEGEWERLADAHGKLHIADLWIRDLPATETEIIASAKRALLRHKIGLVIVDYLQLVICSRRCENRNLEIQHITRTFQRLARETGLPVVVAAQLSRAGEKRSDPKPRMSDLRESGAQEQDVDKLILIHNPNYRRPEQYDGASLARCKALVIVEKHRNGPTGEVQIWFTPAATRFDECTDQAWVEPAQPRAARREDW